MLSFRKTKDHRLKAGSPGQAKRPEPEGVFHIVKNTPADCCQSPALHHNLVPRTHNCQDLLHKSALGTDFAKHEH